MTMKFYDEEHEKAYADILGRMRYNDCYHRTVAYLFGLPVTREHVDDLFDFEESLIKREGLNKGWQTGGSYKTTRLAFNLWNGCHYDIEDGNEDLSTCSWYTPEQIFVVTAFAPYYWQAIQIRFDISEG